MAKKKNKYFTASDCIHLHACRRVTAIAKRMLYGLKGTQTIARGCSKECPLYLSKDILVRSLGYARECIGDARSTLSYHYDDFPTTDPYHSIQGNLEDAAGAVCEVEEFLEKIHEPQQDDELD